MQRCFRLALQGLGNVAPNPLVGAVLVHGGMVIGEGFHARYGGPHAEVMAVRRCKRPELLTRSTLYVNLEPCSHFGKTPPCADLILQHGIPRVVVCNTDPFPEVSGRGIRKLRDAGVEVTTGIEEAGGEALNRRFFTFHREQRPFVILKWAQSADGYVDGTGGEPVRITSSLTDQLTHRWRTQESAILVGYRTALKDNPRLTARHYPGRNPMRIVWDPGAELPRHLHLFTDGEPTLLFNARHEGTEGAVTSVRTENGDPAALLHKLHALQVQSVIIEGGPATLRLFIEHGLWDEARVVTGRLSLGNGVPAPVLRGGRLVRTQYSDGDTLHFFERTKHIPHG